MATDERSGLRTTPAPGAPDPHCTDADLGTDAVALTAELVRIDSVNPGLVPGAAGETAIVGHLRERLQHNGFETHVVTQPGNDDRPSLVAIGPETPPARTPPDPPSCSPGTSTPSASRAWTHPSPPDVDGDRLTGRGASDMKAGVAAMVVAAEELVRRGSPARVVLALVADEEDASLGTEAVLDALPELGVLPDVAVVGEPTWLALAETLRGYALVDVTLTGRPAHSSQPELGVNAVTHLGRLLVAVEERGAAPRRQRWIADGHGRQRGSVAVRPGPHCPGARRAAHGAGGEGRRRPRRGGGAARRPPGGGPHRRRRCPARHRPRGRGGWTTPGPRPPWPASSRPPSPKTLSPRTPSPRTPRSRGSTPPTGWRRRCGRRPASRPSCAVPRAVGCTPPTSGSTFDRSGGMPSPSPPRSRPGRPTMPTDPRRLRGDAPAARRLAALPRGGARRRSRSPGTSSGATSSATSSRATCRSTPDSTR